MWLKIDTSQAWFEVTGAYEKSVYATMNWNHKLPNILFIWKELEKSVLQALACKSSELELLQNKEK